MSNTSATTDRSVDEQSTNERSTVDGGSIDGSTAGESEVDDSGTEGSLVERSNGVLSWLPNPTLLSVLFFLGIPGSLIDSLSWMEEFYLFGLFALWPMLGTVLPWPDSDRNPTDWVTMGTRSRLYPLVSMVYLQFNPFLQLKGLLQIAGHVPVLLCYRFQLPNPDRFTQQVDYRLPVEGEWTVVSGGPIRERSHSWGFLAQRYAYDLVVTDEEGRTHEGEGNRPVDYHCYGEPVIAPANGVVVDVDNGHRDYRRAGGWLDPCQRDPRGNYLTIEHTNSEYSLLAHLQEGSLQVTEGDRVERGERVAQCGHSGNSTEPHLHFQIQDHPSFFRAMGLPIHFSDLRLREPDGETTTRERVYIHEGQRVASSNTVGDRL